MSGISTHILDTASGQPASGVTVHLFFADQFLGASVTNRDGRIPALLAADAKLQSGTYRLVFMIGEYFPQGFYADVTISFRIPDDKSHFHVPLLISPFGYTTYRGS